MKEVVKDFSKEIVKEVEQKQRDNRFSRNNSGSRYNPNQQANNSQKISNKPISKTSNRMNSLEDVYKARKTERVTVPISSKFTNLPTNLRHK
jgi:hypothetical protein